MSLTLERFKHHLYEGVLLSGFAVSRSGIFICVSMICRESHINDPKERIELAVEIMNLIKEARPDLCDMDEKDEKDEEDEKDEDSWKMTLIKMQRLYRHELNNDSTYLGLPCMWRIFFLYEDPAPFHTISV